MNSAQQRKWLTYNETDQQAIHHDGAHRLNGQGTGTIVVPNGENRDDGLERLVFAGWEITEMVVRHRRGA
jgi:hypothetical protein